MTRRAHHRAAALLLCCAAGCVGERVTVAPRPPAAYTTIQPTEGFACGFLAFDLIPFRVNDRVERAYGKALRAGGTTALADVAIEERWYFVVVGTVVCTQLTAQAIRPAP